MAPALHYGVFPMTLIGISEFMFFQCYDINMVLLTKSQRSVRVTLQASNAPNMSQTFGEDKNR